MNQVLGEKGFENTRIGMSGSYSAEVSQRDKFIGRADNNGLGMVWEVRRPRTARDFTEIFKSVNAPYVEEREALFPRGARLRIKPGTKPEVRTRPDGRRYTHIIVEELPKGKELTQ
ncbi:MAG: hypothetical protein LBD01_05105 [Puniceicoccales bacterium]|nr:hypothetical protein [Puniceicoccales bacterium]